MHKILPGGNYFHFSLNMQAHLMSLTFVIYDYLLSISTASRFETFRFARLKTGDGNTMFLFSVSVFSAEIAWSVFIGLI